MDTHQIIEELEALRVRAGRNMMALDIMTPAERNNAFLCDLERMRQITKKLAEPEP